MTDPRWQQLIELIDRLPADKAQNLRELLSSQDFSNIAAEGFTQIMQKLALRSSDAGGGPGPETLMRRVCKRLEPFLVNTVDDGDEGVIARPTLMEWWKAAKAQSRQITLWEEEFTEALGRQDAAAATLVGLTAADQLARMSNTMNVKSASRAAMADIRRIGAILSGGPALYDSLELLGLSGPVTAKTRIELTALLQEQFPIEYAKAADEQIYNPIWLGYAAMNRLNKPWEVLYLVSAIQLANARSIRLEDTELAPLVQRVISLLRQLSSQSVMAIRDGARQRSLEAIRAAIDTTTRYFDAAEVVTAQLKLERDSAWGRIFLTLRKTIAEIIADKITDFEDVLVGFVEDWDEEVQSDPENAPAALAFAAVDLLGIWRARSDRHGFATTFGAFDRRTYALVSRSHGVSEEGKDVWLAQKRRILETLRFV